MKGTQKEKDLDLLVEANLSMNQANLKISSFLSKSVIDRAEENLGVNSENLRRTQLAFINKQQVNHKDYKSRNSARKFSTLPDTIIKKYPESIKRFISIRQLENKDKNSKMYDIKKSLVKACSNENFLIQHSNHKALCIKILPLKTLDDHNRRMRENRPISETSKVTWKSSIKKSIKSNKTIISNEEKFKTEMRFMSPFRSYLDKNTESKRIFSNNSFQIPLYNDYNNESSIKIKSSY